MSAHRPSRPSVWLVLLLALITAAVAFTWPPWRFVGEDHEVSPQHVTSSEPSTLKDQD